MEQSKKKRKHRLNIVDILLLLCLCAVALCGVLFYLQQNKGLDAYPELVWQVTLKDVPNDCVYELTEGDAVYDDLSGVCIGTVISATKTPTILSFAQADNDGYVYAEKTSDDTHTLVIQIAASATKNKNHYYQIGDYTISIGKHVSLRIDSFYSDGICSGLTPGKAEVTA